MSTQEAAARVASETRSDWNNNSGKNSWNGSNSGEQKKKDPRYDPNTLKIRDILERYYVVLQQLNVIAKQLEHIGKVIDRGWGQERITALKQQEKILKDQQKLQQAYVKEIKDNLKVDKDALSTMVSEFVTDYNKANPNNKLSFEGAQFDENGILTNYADFVTKLVEQYNKNADKNAQDKEAQYKFQEQLKDIQMYTDSLNKLQEAEESLYDIENQILDTRIKAVTYEIEYQNEMDSNDLRLIGFKLDSINESGYRTADCFNS